MANGTFQSLLQTFLKQPNQRQQQNQGLQAFGGLIGKQAIFNQQEQAKLANQISLAEAQEKIKQKNKDSELQRSIKLEQAKAKLKKENPSPSDLIIQRFKTAQAAQFLGNDQLLNALTQGDQATQITRPTSAVNEILGGRFGSFSGQQVPIDTSRPKIQNQGGTFSTEETIGVNVNGQELLIPTVVNGQRVSPDEAVQLFIQGKNPAVGKFSSQQEADRAGPLRSQEIGRLRGGQQDLIPKKTSIKGALGTTQDFISRQGLIDENVLKEATKASGKQLQTLIKTSGNLSRVENSFSGLVAQAKRTVNEQGGFGAKAAITARSKRFIRRLGFNENVPLEEQFGGQAGFDAQRQEVILALSPILTGQNRILRSALAMLKKTVPNLPITGTTEAEFGENIRQSMKNAFKLSLGISRGLLTPEKMADLTQNASEDQITDFLTDLVNKTRFTQEDEKFFNSFFKRVIETPATKPVGLFNPEERQFGRFPGTPTGISITSVEDKLQKAKELRKQFSNMSKEEIIRRVNSGR